ncbi:expressed unknown protein [Ectocarpus siliculosus]|uniref:Uncharacterized protein n=1 Tax=Ectocarpus siliculosus TaxID=2880 RepID=D8LTG5_ECTSI|nr:expressed unknown protein [Ectocarpus siliculosus]|eukprot:CBN78006.1 expressed unknown protein [Ectocarpus siliculosus]
MHSVIRIARREQSPKDPPAGHVTKDGPERLSDNRVSEALHRGNKLDQQASLLAQVMDVHQAVAPLLWICLVCLIDLHALEARVSDIFIINAGCQVLHRCIRINARHTAVVEQVCRVVAVMSEPSFTSRTRFMVENIQDAIHEHKLVGDRTNYVLGRVLKLLPLPPPPPQ